jgi:positive regulator of sigma E activity
MTPRNKLLIALPLVAVFVIVLAYYQLFTNTAAVAVIFVLFVLVSLWNRRKFARKQEPGGRKGG